MSVKRDQFDARSKPPAERVGDVTGEPADTEALNRDMAANLANLLEDLEFPATKEQIKNHVNGKPPSKLKQSDILVMLNNLKDNISYESAYDVEKDAGLVTDTGK